VHRGKVEKSESKKRTCSGVSVRQTVRGIRGVSPGEEKAGHGGKDLQNIEVSLSATSSRVRCRPTSTAEDQHSSPVPCEVT